MSGLKTPISYYGGKQNLVDDILPLLDYRKKQFVSLFTGGGAVEIAKRRHEVEVWNDLDNKVITFWEVMQNEKEFLELQKMIKMTLHAEKYHKDAKDILVYSNNMTKVERAWAFWVQTNMSFSNKLFGGFAFANDNSRNLQTHNKRENFSKSYYDRVKLIQIFNRDALDMIELKDTKDTFFFADPPYISAKDAYDCGYASWQFTALLDKLSRIQGTFLLTSYPEPTLDEYRIKHDWVYYKKKIVLAVTGKRAEQKIKIECITMNYKIQQTLKLNFDN